MTDARSGSQNQTKKMSWPLTGIGPMAAGLAILRIEPISMTYMGVGRLCLSSHCACELHPVRNSHSRYP